MALSNGVGSISRPLNALTQATQQAVKKTKGNQIQSIKAKFKVKLGGSKKPQATETESSD